MYVWKKTSAHELKMCYSAITRLCDIVSMKKKQQNYTNGTSWINILHVNQNSTKEFPLHSEGCCGALESSSGAPACDFAAVGVCGRVPGTHSTEEQPLHKLG